MYAGMSQLVEELSNGGSGLSSLGKMLNLDDSEFWKGARIGADGCAPAPSEGAAKDRGRERRLPGGRRH